MKTKHTPGPWTIKEYNTIKDLKYTDNYRIESKDQSICAMHLPYRDTQELAEKEREVNAHLIASAPELLESLKNCVDSLDHWFKRYGDPEGCNSLMMQNARKAIAKAEGGSV